MPHFLSEYTLHDSCWIGLYLQPNFEAVALPRWDTFWTGGRVPYPGATVADWPLLLVRFERVYQVFTTYPTAEERGAFEGLPETVSGAESARVSPGERESLLDTILRAPGGGRVLGLLARRHAAPDHHLARVPPVSRDLARRRHPFLCLDANGVTIPIPDLR